MITAEVLEMPVENEASDRKLPIFGKRADLLARVEEKRRAVLAWLAAEIFSSAAILGQVMGLKKSGTYKTLADMKRDGLIDFQDITWHAASMQLVVLTPHGAAMAGEGEDGFQQGKVAASSIGHQLDVQQARLYLERDGWTGWVSELALREKAGTEARLKVPLLDREWPKVPDGLGSSKHGRRVAVEMERSIKTTKSYRAIVGQYLHMMKLGAIDQVLYVTTSDRVRDALKAKVTGLPTVLMPVGVSPSGGVAFESMAFEDSHKKRLFFTSMDELRKKACESEQESK